MEGVDIADLQGSVQLHHLLTGSKWLFTGLIFLLKEKLVTYSYVNYLELSFGLVNAHGRFDAGMSWGWAIDGFFNYRKGDIFRKRYANRDENAEAVLQRKPSEVWESAIKKIGTLWHCCEIMSRNSLSKINIKSAIYAFNIRGINFKNRKVNFIVYPSQLWDFFTWYCTVSTSLLFSVMFWLRKGLTYKWFLTSPF